MELGNVSADKLGQIQKSLQALKWKLGWNIEIETQLIKWKGEQKILDESIVDLKKWMSAKDFSVEDLLGE